MIHKNWAELIKPTQLVVRPGADATRTATLVAEPLERGFGLTLGNALRRVLLSMNSTPLWARLIWPGFALRPPPTIAGIEAV